MGQEGDSKFQVTEMIEWGQEEKHKKNPWTKIQPPKNPMLKVTNTDENERL